MWLNSEQLRESIEAYINKIDTREFTMMEMRQKIGFESYQTSDAKKILDELISKKKLNYRRIAITGATNWSPAKYQRKYFRVDLVNNAEKLVDKVRKLVGPEPVVTLANATDDQLLEELKKRIGR